MCFLSNAPFERFSLAMYPSDQIFLKASILRGPSAGAGGGRPVSAQRCIDKDLPAVLDPAHFLPWTFREPVQSSV